MFQKFSEKSGVVFLLRSGKLIIRTRRERKHYRVTIAITGDQDCEKKIIKVPYIIYGSPKYIVKKNNFSEVSVKTVR